MKQKLNSQPAGLDNIRVWLLTVLILIIVRPVLADEKSSVPSPVQGFVDSVVVEGNQLTIQGWAGASTPNSRIVSLSVWFADTLLYEGRVEPIKRPDVAKAMGRNDWLGSGWHVRTELPDDLKNKKSPVKVLVKFDNGSSGELSLNDQVRVAGGLPQSNGVLTYKITLITLFLLLCAVYFRACFLANWLVKKIGYFIKPPVIFGFTLFLSFSILLSMGVTGSSLGIGLEQTPFVQADATKIWLENQTIRSDEWLIFTPLAIAQYNHQPKFPVINTHLGEDGQNMLIVGMAGVPVAHISALAKPATWGFFLFDLKRALSWYWFFPIFACLLALWRSVALLLPGQWRLSFLIALWFSVSPYVTAWSNWPAYTVFFPCLAFISAIAILRSDNKYLLLASGCVLGVALAGFVLVLYPPWQVSIGYVFLALTVGTIVRDRLYRNFSKFKLICYVAAMMISGLILWEWWLDAHPAIQAMMATVYPGQRTATTGGYVTLPGLLRGFTNVFTLYKMDGAYSNQSEIASFSYMLLPLALLFIFRLYQKKIGAVEIALVLSIGFILYFALVGIPAEVAQLSLWGRVLPERADVALGLSNIILCGVLLSSGESSMQNKMAVRVLALVVALIWAGIVFHSISRLPESVVSNFTPAVFVGLCSGVVMAGYWLALGKYREFIYFNLTVSMATTLSFNPINVAPHNITATSFVNEFGESKSNNFASQRILVLETQIPAMYLLAGGLSVANGVFYYPQKLLWERLDKNHTESNTYNRYQHLLFSKGIVQNMDHYRIDSPSADVVKVVMDLENFDFRKTGAELIAAPEHEEQELRKNSALIYIKTEKGWSWFQTVEGA